MVKFERIYYEQSQHWNKDFQSIPAERERILRTTELIPADVRNVLDVGCGNGSFLNSLLNRYQTVGLDFTKESLKHVRTNKVYGDISELPFGAQSFDLVTCLEVLEHLSYETFCKALEQLQRVARKYIIISVPNNEDLNYALVICPVCRCCYNAHRHVRSFGPGNLKTLLHRFQLLELKEIGPLRPYPRYNRALYGAYRLWRNVPPPTTAVCPQCGFQTIESQKSTETRWNSFLLFATSLFKLLTKVIWPPRWHRQWLLALYVRKNLEEFSEHRSIR